MEAYTYENYKNSIASGNNKKSKESKVDYFIDYEDDFEDCDDEDGDSTIQPEQTVNPLIKKKQNSCYQSKKYQVNSRSTSSSQLSWTDSNKQSSKRSSDSSGKFQIFDRREDCSSQNKSNSEYDGELFSFDQMREKIYSEVANLISQNETRPFYLIRLFKELQYLKEKNARDQVLKSIFTIANRQTYESEMPGAQEKRTEKKLSETSSSESEKECVTEPLAVSALSLTLVDVFSTEVISYDNMGVQWRRK